MIFRIFYAFLYYALWRFCFRNPTENSAGRRRVGIARLAALLEHRSCPPLDAVGGQDLPIVVRLAVESPILEGCLEHLFEFLWGYSHFSAEYLDSFCFRNVQLQVLCAVDPLEELEVEGIPVVAVQRLEDLDLRVGRGICIVREVV